MARALKVYAYFASRIPCNRLSSLGAIKMVEEENSLPLQDCYVRCAEEHKIPGKGKFRLVICMYEAMSALLLETKRPTIDTSFKRLHKWLEFEIESWFPSYDRCEFPFVFLEELFVDLLTIVS